MNPLAAGLCGAVALAGIALAVAGWRGALPELSRPAGTDTDTLTQSGLLAMAGFAAGLLLTGWPVAAAYLAFGGAAVPSLLRAKRDRRAALEKVEALASWAETLRDIMLAGAGLHQTLRTSARVAPAAIQTEVRDLSVRLQHESIDTALVKFAADLDHPTADTIVAALLIASRWQAAGLPEVLSSVASAAREEAAMRQRIESTRQRTYTQSRIVVVTSFSFILFLVLTRRPFLEPYDSIGGQIALMVIGGMFAFSGYAMHKLGRPQVPLRVFGRLERMVRSAEGIRAR